ncbi:MAG: type II toxin-antitoxin system RelE/ParE family toxin [Desulfovibrio sp.]|nr:type II toxin-antitoxin system RelE/ParE family toxin [Desulfovibrio sp.]
MSNKTVRWLHLALQDLHDLMQHYEENTDRATVEAMATRIWEAGQSLNQLSLRGRPGKVPNTRELVLTNAPYYLSYRVQGTDVQILRIIHFARRTPEQ